MTKIAYVAIRKNIERNYYWIDHESIGHGESSAIKKAELKSEAEPDWHKANPIVRISKVEIKEIDTIPYVKDSQACSIR